MKCTYFSVQFWTSFNEPSIYCLRKSCVFFLLTLTTIYSCRMYVEVYTKKHGNLGPFVIHDIWTIFSFFSIFGHPILYHLPGCSLWKGLNDDYKWVPLKCCWMTKQIIIFNLSQFSLTYWTIKGFTSRVLIWSFNGAYWILLITCISVPCCWEANLCDLQCLGSFKNITYP